MESFVYSVEYFDSGNTLPMCIEAVTTNGVIAKILSTDMRRMKRPLSDPTSIQVTEDAAVVEVASLRKANIAGSCCQARASFRLVFRKVGRYRTNRVGLVE